MQQTLLAFVALMAVMQLTLSQQQTIVNAQVGMVDDEVETIATGLGQNVLDYIASLPFDAATAGGGATVDRDQLTATFATGGTYEAATDIDDFHGLTPYTLTSSFGGLSVTIAAQVYYVEEAAPDQVSTSQTYAKKVILTIDSDELDNTLYMSRVYTYP